MSHLRLKQVLISLVYSFASIAIVVFLSFIPQKVNAQTQDAQELKSIVEDATNANGYGYNVTDIPNADRLDTVKIIETSPKNYIGVYHTCEKISGNCDYMIVKLARSTDLANWYFVRDLFPAAQPTIAKLSNGGYLLAYENWHNSSTVTIKFVYYQDLNSLFSGNYSYQFDAPNTFSNLEGTPNIYSVTLSPDILHSQISVGFHYYDREKNGDRDAKATLTNFSSWSAQPDTQINSKLEALGLTVIGDRDTMNFRGKQYALIEGATGTSTGLTWRIYLFDYSQNEMIPLSVETKNGSISISNPTFSNITLPLGMPGIVMAYFIHDWNHGESGELIFYKKYPSYTSGKVTDCTTGAGIPGVNILVFNNRNNPISTSLSDGTWASYETSFGDDYGVWPQCVSGFTGMPYNPPSGYLCNNTIGPRALNSPNKFFPGTSVFPHIGNYYDQAVDGIPTSGYNSYNFCYTPQTNTGDENPTPTPIPTATPTATPTPTVTPTPTPTQTPTLINLALNKKVVFKGQVVGYEGYKAVDGNPQTTWLQTSKTGWLYVDLGSKKSISRIYVNTGFEAKFYIQVSDDAKNWRLVWDHNWDNIGFRRQQTINLNTSARYVLFGNVDNKSDPYTHLYDFQVLTP